MVSVRSGVRGGKLQHALAGVPVPRTYKTVWSHGKIISWLGGYSPGAGPIPLWFSVMVGEDPGPQFQAPSQHHSVVVEHWTVVNPLSSHTLSS